MSPGPSEIDLARYRLIRLLGRGGMGEVYLAEDQVLQRRVAVKFVAPDKITEPEARKRLLHEAQSAAGLDHEGICTVYEAGHTTDGRECIVMQYVEGETLEQILVGGPLDVQRALDLCLHVAEALGAAHRHRVIHRDLKPGNIILTASGRPKLLDFGIAKVVPPADTFGNASTVSGVTTQGHIIGTPAYMSPEQVMQHPVDGRSDLFSLGAVLYECLTGRRAFAGPTAFETIANVLHLNPPPPSTLRPELDDSHDRLCHRLLAKNPESRFQSADEAVGALRLTSGNPQPKTGTQTGSVPPKPPRPYLMAGAAFVLLAVLAGGFWWLIRPTPLPTVPDNAQRWYQKGLEALREGAYLTARGEFNEAVKLFPQFALAYARLAEADAELDDERAAQGHLLRVSTLVPDESRLPALERLRLQAVRALVLRDVDAAVAAYRRLAEELNDTGAWLDLGRAQEASGLRTDARQSYERAISKDRQNAAAYLRLGYVHGLESRRQDALAAFAEAERLYVAASDLEGRTEVLLRRGLMFDALGESKAARVDLEQAQTLSRQAGAIYRDIRSRLALSSVMASEGALRAAEKMASEAVAEAVSAGLDTVAADGLIDLAATLQLEPERVREADAHLQRALRLADERSARRTAARARLQLGSLRETQNRPSEALALVNSVLPFLRGNHYRRFELNGLSIAVRAHQALDQLEEARGAASTVLDLATSVKDAAQVAVAASNLASVETALGHYPAALRLRERAEGIRRQQGNDASLPFDLANRADLLIRMGRVDAADPVLSELEAGIAAKREAYVLRSSRVNLYRGLAAAVSLRCPEALAALASLRPAPDYPGVIGPAVVAFCRARLRLPSMRTAADAVPPESKALEREQHHWLGRAALERGEARAALHEAERGLAVLGRLPNEELRWRLAAIGAVASSLLNDETRRRSFAEMAHSAFARLERAWQSDAAVYARRPDVVDLRDRVQAPQD